MFFVLFFSSSGIEYLSMCIWAILSFEVLSLIFWASLAQKTETDKFHLMVVYSSGDRPGPLCSCFPLVDSKERPLVITSGSTNSSFPYPELGANIGLIVLP